MCSVSVFTVDVRFIRDFTKMYDSPSSLQNVCASYIGCNIEAFCEVNQTNRVTDIYQSGLFTVRSMFHFRCKVKKNL